MIVSLTGPGSPLRVELADEHKCESCGVPGWAGQKQKPDGARVQFRVPGVSHRFCSILCAECFLFGPGRCRWCGDKLAGHGNQRFCDESCAQQSSATKFGNGRRLLNWLRRNHPDVYLALARDGFAIIQARPRIAPTGVCLYCQGPLPDKRRDAAFCSDRCRKAHTRRFGRRENWRIIADTEPIKSAVYESQDQPLVG